MRGDSGEGHRDNGCKAMTATAANLAARLEALIGAHRVVVAEEELYGCEVDGVVPHVVVRPANAGEVAEVVRFAAAEKLAVIASGSRSKMEIGMPPVRYDIALDMKEMREIAHYDAGDMTLSVDAGIGLRQLEMALAEKQQLLPLAVPCFESSTVGGTIASGIDSALRQQYGTARDFLIGAEFVDGKGNLCKSGGRVVKNVTGYDLHKLLIGSLGTLGVITRLNFRTFPAPAVCGGHLASFENGESAFAFRQKIEASGLPVANFEMLNPEITKIVSAILKKEDGLVPESLDGQGWCVYTSYEGNEPVVNRVAKDVVKLAAEAEASGSEVLEPAADSQVGGLLREAFEWIRWAAPLVGLFRITLPRASWKDLVGLSGSGEDSPLRGSLLFRSAGVVYFALMAENENEETLAAVESAASEVFSFVEARGGHGVLLHSPVVLKTRRNVWGRIADTRMMRRVKQAFDPHNIFAPGRFVGDI